MNGKAVAAPYRADKILVVDPATGQASTIDLPSGINLRQGFGRKFGSICAVNGKAVAAPCDADKILVVDPATGQASSIDLPSGIDPQEINKFESICAVNGKAVAAPYHADKILVVDPASGQASSIDLPSGINPRQAGKFGSICAVNGKAVAAPYNADQILVVDPATGQASTIDLPSGINPWQGRKFWSICAVNGKAVAAPFDAPKILVAEVPRSSEVESSSVHLGLEFPELVAAALSSWIYTDDADELAPPRTIPNASFQIHQVITPRDLGAALKMATVTATLPTEKVLFVIFKGTSYILDFLNWNLELDYTVTADKDFFAHRGAAGTLLNARFLKNDAFLKRLRSERANGVRKVVFTGHSLGGMYAQMSLYLAWRSLTSPEPSDEKALLESVDLRCFVFGSPMVFGGSSQQANEFRTFAQRCALNYIHADDPCARAWGAINLRQFVQQASLAARKGLTNELGGIKGSIVSGVVDGMASTMMNRPDFSLIEDFARKYEHFLPLKVLSTKRPSASACWKEFNLTSKCFMDHNIENYVDKLYDALDDSRPECYVHSTMP